MFELKVESKFSSAHFLKNYNGKCENIHGHNWNVLLSVCGDKLDDAGLVIDFKDLKNVLTQILDTLDHKCINETDAFKNINPSCEYISKYIYDEAKNKLNKDEVFVKSVRVWETEKASCVYYEK